MVKPFKKRLNRSVAMAFLVFLFNWQLGVSPVLTVHHETEIKTKAMLSPWYS